MDPRFTVVHHPERRGLGAARDSGLQLVDTEYVSFFDADDIMEPDALALLVGSLARTRSDIAAGAYRRLRSGPDGDVLSEIQPWVAASTAPARSGVTLAEHPSVVNNIVAWSKVSRARGARTHDPRDGRAAPGRPRPEASGSGVRRGARRLPAGGRSAGPLTRRRDVARQRGRPRVSRPPPRPRGSGSPRAARRRGRRTVHRAPAARNACPTRRSGPPRPRG